MVLGVTRRADGRSTIAVAVRAAAEPRSDGWSPRSGHGRAGWGNHRSRPPSHTTGTATARSSRPRGPDTPGSRSSEPQRDGRRRHAHMGADRHGLHHGGEFPASGASRLARCAAVDTTSQPRRAIRGNDRNLQGSSSGPIAGAVRAEASHRSATVVSDGRLNKPAGTKRLCRHPKPDIGLRARLVLDIRTAPKLTVYRKTAVRDGPTADRIDPMAVPRPVRDHPVSPEKLISRFPPRSPIGPGLRPRPVGRKCWAGRWHRRSR